MPETSTQAGEQVALITGAGRRIGATIARALHAEGIRVVLHYHRSDREARELQDELNRTREGSAVLIQCDLLEHNKHAALIHQAAEVWGRLDILVNNASTFYPTPIGRIREADWDDLLGTNLKAPLFLSQAAAPWLARHRGCIVNLTDIHAERPLKGHSVYCIAKAGLAMLTYSLARELGPDIRVNGIAPGAILWPEGLDDVTRQRIISQTALKRHGSPEDIARAVVYLVRDGGFVSGQILTVDGGRSLGH